MNRHERKQAIESVATIGQFLLSDDWSYLDMLAIRRAKQQLDCALSLFALDELEPVASPISLVSSRRTLPAGSIRLSGTAHYCRGCGFTFDPSNSLAAAQHTSH